jgi:hypothetical protein
MRQLRRFSRFRIWLQGRRGPRTAQEVVQELEQEGWEVHAAARTFLEEYGGLHVADMEFDPCGISTPDGDVRFFEYRLNPRLCPIGLHPGEHASLWHVLLMSNDGHVYQAVDWCWLYDTGGTGEDLLDSVLCSLFRAPSARWPAVEGNPPEVPLKGDFRDRERWEAELIEALPRYGFVPNEATDSWDWAGPPDEYPQDGTNEPDGPAPTDTSLDP